MILKLNCFISMRLILTDTNPHFDKKILLIRGLQGYIK